MGENMQRLISSVYLRGDESAAHYKSFRSPTKRGVPKNILKPSAIARINKHTYATDMSGVVVHDKLLEMLK